MKKTLIAGLILISSAAGICLANNATGNAPNPPNGGGPSANPNLTQNSTMNNTMDNRTYSNAANY